MKVLIYVGVLIVICMQVTTTTVLILDHQFWVDEVPFYGYLQRFVLIGAPQVVMFFVGALTVKAHRL